METETAAKRDQGRDANTALASRSHSATTDEPRSRAHCKHECRRLVLLYLRESADGLGKKIVSFIVVDRGHLPVRSVPPSLCAQNLWYVRGVSVMLFTGGISTGEPASTHFPAVAKHRDRRRAVYAVILSRTIHSIMSRPPPRLMMSSVLDAWRWIGRRWPGFRDDHLFRRTGSRDSWRGCCRS